MIYAVNVYTYHSIATNCLHEGHKYVITIKILHKLGQGVAVPVTLNNEK